MENKSYRKAAGWKKDRGERGRVSNRQAEASNEERIEDYLDHLCAPLVGAVAYDVRQALRAEMRAHLLARAAAYEEMGSAPDAAVRAALAQFGDPQRIGQEWLRAWRNPGGVESPLPATVTALGWFGLASLFVVPLLTVDRNFDVSFGSAATLQLVMVLPLLTGLITGLYARTRAALGTFYALAALIPLTAALYLHVNDRFLFLVFAQTAFWMPIGCASAALGTVLRRRNLRARRRWIPS